MKQYISIDIGGTSIKYGLVSEAGVLLDRAEKKTEAFKGGPAILKKVLGIVEEAVSRTEIDGVCISTAGMVDVEKGEIFYSAPLIPDYAGTAYKKVIEETFHLPCEVENDVNCAGLAEYYSGASKGTSSAVMLTIGTGIGGSMILDGRLVRGFSGSACEVGYMHMDDSDFQTLGATSILSKKVAARKKESEEKWTGYLIFEEAKKGDAICIQAIDEMTDTLGKGIANICYVVNPQVVVLGGGIMAQKAYLEDRIKGAVRKYLVSSIAEKTEIRFAEHQNDAGMLGAFYHFQERKRKKE